MEEFGDRCHPRTNVLTTEKDKRLQKFAYGYFQLKSFNKNSFTSRFNKLLRSYPSWIIMQKQFEDEDFYSSFQIMIEAHPQQLSIFEKQDRTQQTQASLFKTIDHIRFPYLKKLEIYFQHETCLEAFGWFDAPSLEQICIWSKSLFSSITTLAKTNFSNLKTLKVETFEKKISKTRNYDLSKASRIISNAISMFILYKDNYGINFLSKHEQHKQGNY